METEEYLKNTLKKEGLNEKSDEMDAMQAEKINVEKAISAAFDGSPVIKYAGSCKKGTMVKSSYDLDITCYFKREDNSAGETLEEIFNNVQVALAKKYFITPKRSALRLQSQDKKLDFHIDVVPGRFVDETETDCFLHQTTGDKERLKTNLDVHISHIKNSGLTKTIQLVKIWRNIFVLPVKTFVLELLVVKILDKNKDQDGLEKCLKIFFEQVATNIKNIALKDPANSGNDLSPIFNETVKQNLSQAADRTMTLIKNDKWIDLFGPIEEENREYTTTAVQKVARSNGPTPWLSE